MLSVKEQRKVTWSSMPACGCMLRRYCCAKIMSA